MSITTEVITVSPVLAKNWLSRNIQHNRKVKKSTVAHFAKLMANSLWKLNGEAIKFDANGNLVDGQHRLYACLQAGVAFQTLVVRGLSQQDFYTLDGRGVRRVADFIDSTDRTTKASIIQALYRYQNGNEVSHSSGNTGAAPIEAMSMYESQRELIDLGNRYANRLRDFGAPSVLGFAALYYSSLSPKKDKQKVDRFVDDVCSGIGLNYGDPALTLRERLLKLRASKSKVTKEITMGFFMRAYCAYRDGKKLFKLPAQKVEYD
jgi:hypothetical protein